MVPFAKTLEAALLMTRFRTWNEETGRDFIDYLNTHRDELERVILSMEALERDYREEIRTKK